MASLCRIWRGDFAVQISLALSMGLHRVCVFGAGLLRPILPDSRRREPLLRGSTTYFPCRALEDLIEAPDCRERSLHAGIDPSAFRKPLASLASILISLGFNDEARWPAIARPGNRIPLESGRWPFTMSIFS